MSEFMFGVTRKDPGRKKAKKWDRICREEGGYGFDEINVVEGETPGINYGYYQGWFAGPNRGAPEDGELAKRVFDRIEREGLAAK